MNDVFQQKVWTITNRPPSLILKIELFAFLAIFARYTLVKYILVEVLYVFRVIKKKSFTS